MFCQFLQLSHLSYWFIRVLKYIYSGYKSLISMWFTNIFSHFADCLFTLLMVSFEAQKFLFLMKSNVSVFSFVGYTLGVISKNSFPNPGSQRFIPMFSSKSFIVLAITFMTYFVLIFVHSISWGSKFFILFCIWVSSCPSIICWKTILFSLKYLGNFVKKWINHKCKELFLDSQLCSIDLSILMPMPSCFNVCSL